MPADPYFETNSHAPSCVGEVASLVFYLLNNRLETVQPWAVVAIDPRRNVLVRMAKQCGAVIIAMVCQRRDYPLRPKATARAGLSAQLRAIIS
jgi:hypothetical protein